MVRQLFENTTKKVVMKASDFWEAVNVQPVRSISIRFWPEKIDYRNFETQIEKLVTALDLWPANAGVSTDVWEKPKTKKWKSIDDFTLEAPTPIEGVAIYSNRPKTTENIAAASRTIVLQQDLVFISAEPHYLTVSLGIKIIKPLLDFLTPTFGFSLVTSKAVDISYHSNTPSSDMSRNDRSRVEAYQQVAHLLPNSENHLSKRLLDVFELNFLSPHHLRSRIFNVSFEDWVDKGRRGELQQIGSDVYAWIVPEDIRPSVRLALLNAGFLIAPI
jgi:hypothetical protein